MINIHRVRDVVKSDFDKLLTLTINQLQTWNDIALNRTPKCTWARAATRGFHSSGDDLEVYELRVQESQPSMECEFRKQETCLICSLPSQMHTEASVIPG